MDCGLTAGRNSLLRTAGQDTRQPKKKWRGTDTATTRTTWHSTLEMCIPGQVPCSKTACSSSADGQSHAQASLSRGERRKFHWRGSHRTESLVPRTERCTPQEDKLLLRNNVERLQGTRSWTTSCGAGQTRAKGTNTGLVVPGAMLSAQLCYRCGELEAA